MEDNCYVNDKFIGTTVAKKITVNILNPNNEIDLENKEVAVEAGIKLNNTEEKIPFGTFIISKPPTNEEVKENTSFTGYDYMIKFNIPYKNRVTFPCKAKVLFQDLCNQVGLVAGNTDFINEDYMILGNPFTNNEDCRTVLSNIAQLAGGFAKIGRDNKVYIKTLKNVSSLLKVKDVHVMKVKDLNLQLVNMMSGLKENSDENLDGNNYFEDFAKNNMWGELNSLIIGLSSIEGENTALDDKNSIEKNGLTEIQINDNYFLSDEAEREKVITPLWNSLKGIKYLPFKTNYYGYPYVDSGDLIYIEDTKDIGYVSYIFNHTFKFNGTFNGRIETPAITKTQTAYKNTVDIKTRFKNAERKIDKLNGVIEDVIKEQSDTSEKLTEVKQTVDGINTTIRDVETTVETITEETIKSVDVMYALSTSTTTAPTSGWSSTAPQWQSGKYMWQKTITTYANGKKEETSATCISGANGKDGINGANGQNGEKGDTGIGVKAIEEQFYLSNSNITQSGSSWKTTQDTWTNGKYIWTRSKITWTDNTTTYTEPVLATGLNTANANAQNAKDKADSVESEITTVKTNITNVVETAKEHTRQIASIEETTKKMKIGATNILRSTNITEKLTNPGIWSTGTWRSASGGTGTREKINVSDSPNPNIKLGWHIKSTNLQVTICQDDVPTAVGEEYTISCYAKGSGKLYLQYGNATLGYQNTQIDLESSTEWKKYSFKLISKGKANAYFGVNATDHEVYICGMKMEVGNVATDWTPAPEDIEKTITDVSSTFTQTATDIIAKVDKKIDNETLTGAEIALRINNDNSSEVKISGDKIDIEGQAVKFKTDIKSEYSFTNNDLQNIQKYIMGQITLTQAQKELYDVNKDGEIKPSDYVIVKNKMNSNGNVILKGTLEIDPYSASRTIILKDEKGNISTSIGLLGIQTQSLGAEELNINRVNFDNFLTDYTSKITAVNGAITGGKVFKMGRIAFWQITYISYETSSWAEMLSIPPELAPLGSNSAGDSVYIQGENKTIYNELASTPLQIKGPKTNNENIFLTFSYITES